MLTPQEKLKLMRSAEVSPGLALFQFFDIIGDQIMALLSAGFTKLQEEQSKKDGDVVQALETISTTISEALSEFKASVEEINQRVLDEDTIAEALSEKITVPTPTDGRTPTETELTAIIKKLIPEVKGKHIPKEEIIALVKSMLPKKGEEPKPMGEEELTALIQPIVEKLNSGDDKEDSELLKKVKALEEQLRLLLQLPRTEKVSKNKKHGGGHGGGSMAVQTISGTINSVNLAFTVPIPVTGQSFISLNGQILIQGVDYTISGTNIAMSSAPHISLAGTTFVLICTL